MTVPISTVNREVSIEQVCGWIGMRVYPSSERRSAKMYCPFGEFSHSDGGQDPAFRIYPDNHAYCFACKQYFTPVSLFAQAEDLSQADAADRLTELAHLRPRSWEELWEYAAPHREISPENLASALRIRCQSLIPGWDRLQYVPQMAECIARSIALLDTVSDEAQAERWLTAAALSAVQEAGKVSTGG